jgi:hypothetical protein
MTRFRSKSQLRKIILMLGIVASSVMPARAAEEGSLPELLTIAYADCERVDFLRAASAFPLDSKKLAAIELTATKLNQTVQNTPEKKRELCQSVLLVIEQRHALEVMTWDTPAAQLVWLDFIIKTLKAQQVAPKYENIIGEAERMDNCPNANADGKVTIRGMVEDCGSYSPTSSGYLWCSDWRTIGDHRRVAQLKVVGAPKEVSDPVRRAQEADLECYKKARADGASGWSPAYECPTADKLSPMAEATYKAYVATHPLPWKTQKEECVALKPLIVR